MPLFVLDDAILRSRFAAPNRLAFMLDSLRDLDESLRKRGARLFVRRGDPVREAIAASPRRRTRSEIHVSADYSAFARARERRLRRPAKSERIELTAHPGATVVPPGRADARRRRPLPRLHPLLAALERRRPAAQQAGAPREPRGPERPARRADPGARRAAERRAAPPRTCPGRRGRKGRRRMTGLPARRHRRLRVPPRRPSGRPHLAHQRLPALRLRLTAGAARRGARQPPRRRLRAPALLARLPPPGPRRLPVAAAPRLPPPRRPLVAVGAGARGLAGRAHRLPDRRRGDAPARSARGTCTTARG